MDGANGGCAQYFIRLATASTIGRRMKYLNEPLDVAAKACVEELRRDGGLGGVIALDNAGNGECSESCSFTLGSLCFPSHYAIELFWDVPGRGVRGWRSKNFSFC